MTYTRASRILVAILFMAALASLALELGYRSSPPAQAQQAGTAEMSLDVLTASNLHCLPATKPDKCFVEMGSQFTVTANMNTIPTGGYGRFTMDGVHTGLTSKAVRVVAPGFQALGPTGVGTESFLAGGITSFSEFPLPKSNHLGSLVEADLNCPTTTATFKISLPVPSTQVGDTNSQPIPITTVLQDTTKVADTLLITCIDPLDFDKDGDGCTTRQELGPGPRLGGQRNPNDPWDYADMPDPNATPMRDRVVLSADILRVVLRYRANDNNGAAAINRYTDPLSTPPKTGYHPAYDRGGVIPGGDPWDLLPPDGSIVTADILAVVKQYRHNCA